MLPTQELTESAGDSSHWARNYLKDGQLFMGEKPNSVALQGVDCFYSHPVSECEAARSAPPQGAGRGAERRQAVWRCAAAAAAKDASPPWRQPRGKS